MRRGEPEWPRLVVAGERETTATVGIGAVLASSANRGGSVAVVDAIVLSHVGVILAGVVVAWVRVRRPEAPDERVAAAVHRVGAAGRVDRALAGGPVGFVLWVAVLHVGVGVRVGLHLALAVVVHGVVPQVWVVHCGNLATRSWVAKPPVEEHLPDHHDRAGHA